MSSLIKKLVSTPTKSYTNDYGIPLDLSYITDRILVCSCPVSTFPQVLYRNSINDLVNFLDISHPSHWSIWNFKNENPDDYSFALENDLKNKLHHFPWPDHEAPPFQLILSAVASIHQYLEDSPSNVAVLHCKMGKGRSGLIAVAYLMIYENYSRIQACQLFTKKRMKQGFGEGVSILSQLKYLSYCSYYKVLPYQPQLLAPKINSIRVLLFEQKDTHPYQDFKLSLVSYDLSKPTSRIQLAPLDRMPKNKKIVIYQVDQLLKAQDLRLEVDATGFCAFTCSVSTSFNVYWELVSLNKKIQKGVTMALRCHWNEMDGFKGTPFKGKQLFDYIETHISLI